MTKVGNRAYHGPDEEICPLQQIQNNCYLNQWDFFSAVSVNEVSCDSAISGIS